MPRGVSLRRTLAPRAQKLRAEGWKLRAISERLGVPIQTVGEWTADPDRTKHAARRAKYGGICVDCGAKTDGSRGPGKASQRCADCDCRRLAAKTREEARPRRELAERMWREGFKSVDICEAVGWSTRYASAAIGHRRVLGWDFPQRKGKNARKNA